MTKYNVNIAIYVIKLLPLFDAPFCFHHTLTKVFTCRVCEHVCMCERMKFKCKECDYKATQMGHLAKQSENNVCKAIVTLFTGVKINCNVCN